MERADPVARYSVIARADVVVKDPLQRLYSVKRMDGMSIRIWGVQDEDRAATPGRGNVRRYVLPERGESDGLLRSFSPRRQ
jgi:hypothetical protein